MSRLQPVPSVSRSSKGENSTTSCFDKNWGGYSGSRGKVRSQMTSGLDIARLELVFAFASCLLAFEVQLFFPGHPNASNIVKQHRCLCCALPRHSLSLISPHTQFSYPSPFHVFFFLFLAQKKVLDEISHGVEMSKMHTHQSRPEGNLRSV